MGQVSAQGGGYDPQVDPGPVNPPAIFEPSTAIVPGSAPQVWIAASGGANWGGCLVSISFDGANYDYIGAISSPAYQGALAAALAAASGLDTAGTLAIDLGECEGVLPTAATNADATNFRTLCYLCAAFAVSGGTAVVPNNGELLAYGAVAATGAYTNNLTYLERGLYGTSGSAHASGDFFSRIDLGEIDAPPNSVVTYNLPPQYIGATVYLKLQSFNVFGNATQDIATVTEYVYTPSGQGYGGGASGAPTAPTGLAGYPFHGFASLQWTANPPGDHVTSYDVLRRASGIGSYAVIGASGATFYSDNTVVSGASYDYEIAAVNAAGASAPSASVTVALP